MREFVNWASNICIYVKYLRIKLYDVQDFLQNNIEWDEMGYRLKKLACDKDMQIYTFLVSFCIFEDFKK